MALEHRGAASAGALGRLPGNVTMLPHRDPYRRLTLGLWTVFVAANSKLTSLAMLAEC